MHRKIKILVIGNCQARPVAKLLAKNSSQIDALQPIITHLSRPEMEIEHLKQFNHADFILAQLTQDTFSVPHLRSKYIKEQFPNKTFIWPNIFSASQQPFLRYVTHRLKKIRIQGPLEAYHDLRILSSWYENHGQKQLKLPVEDSVHRTSLEQLQDRERFCDVKVSDLIATNLDRKRLFFTFNHPTLWLLVKMLERLVDLTPFKVEFNNLQSNEPLGRIIAPSIFDNCDDAIYQGPMIQLKSKVEIHSGPAVQYNYERLRNTFFEAYTNQGELLFDFDNLNYTPNIM